MTVQYDSFSEANLVWGMIGTRTTKRDKGSPFLRIGNVDTADIDGDGFANVYDLDSDDDGCSDSNEAYRNATLADKDKQYGMNAFPVGTVAPITPGTPPNSFDPVGVPSTGQVLAASYTLAGYTPVVTKTTVNAPANFDLSGTVTAAFFTASATGTLGGESFTWERSLNGQSNWTPVVNGEVVSGATFTISFDTKTLDITNIVGSALTALNNSYYRAVMTDAVYLACGPITSGHARLGLPTPPNPLPIAVDNDYSILEDTTVTLTPLAGDSDPTNEPLRLVSIGGTNLTPGVAQSIVVANGIVNITAAGVITFTPTLNYFNTPTTRIVIPYVITDETSNATANQNIEVRSDNDAPVANPDTYSVVEDPTTALILTPLTTNLDTDIDGDVLKITVINGVALTPNIAQSIPVTNGTINITAANVISFTPAKDFNSTTAISVPYRINDGSNAANSTADSTIFITVTPSPDAPEAKDDTYTTAEDVAVILNPLALDTDVDGDALTIVSINGTDLTPGTAQTIPVTNGTIDITAAGVITFTPTLHFTSPPALSIPYVIRDETLLTDTANILITVVANIPPVANHVIASTLKDTNVDVQVASAATDVDGTINIATIDLDPTTPSIETTWTVDGEGTYTANANGTVTFDPLPAFGGVATPVDYTIQDNTGEVSNIATIKVTVNLDSDGDGVLDSTEALDGTDPNNACDSLEDHVTLDRTAAFLNADCDGDGVTNAEEFGNNNLIPFDSNGNGEPDYLEINNYKLSNSEDDIEVFNAVSPASDDIKNNVFTIRNIEKYPDNSVQIYNRWGVVVYEASGYGQGDKFFGGISEGRSTITASAELPADTYFYVLKYVNSNGDTKERTGYLYINR
jgi:CshA-type fibril repeat protein